MREMAWKKAPSPLPFGSGAHALGIGRLRAVMQRYISTMVLTGKAVKALAIGEVLAVKADDRAFVPDIEAWCKKTGNELVGIETKEGFFQATLRRVQ